MPLERRVCEQRLNGAATTVSMKELKRLRGSCTIGKLEGSKCGRGQVNRKGFQEDERKKVSERIKKR